jgi:hypothetical protein
VEREKEILGEEKEESVRSLQDVNSQLQKKLSEIVKMKEEKEGITLKLNETTAKNSCLEYNVVKMKEVKEGIALKTRLHQKILALSPMSSY